MINAPHMHVIQTSPTPRSDTLILVHNSQEVIMIFFVQGMAVELRNDLPSSAQTSLRRNLVAIYV